MKSPPGDKPDCNDCTKAHKACEWPLPGHACVCQCCKGTKLKCTICGVPESVKRLRVAGPDSAGLSGQAPKTPLLIESESDGGVVRRVLMTGLVHPVVEALELVEVVRAHTEVLQGQVETQEWLGDQMEHMAIALDLHRGSVEGLLEVLTSVGRGFGVGLGTGLDVWAGLLPRAEWGGITAGQEVMSEGEEDETLS